MQSFNLRPSLLILSAFLVSGCATSTPTPASGPAPTITINNHIESFAPINAVIDDLSARYGADDVLVVLDIDNTILTSAVDLGGDVWYQWQRGRLEPKRTDEQEVACLFEDSIGLLYELGPMLLTEDSLPERIRTWQDRGNTVFALTSRSPKYRTATERELKRLGMDFTRTPLAPAGEPAPVFREMAASEWSYMQGIMMTTGMNKGIMLSSLLERTGRQFAAIVFVDDTRRHIDDMFTTYQVSQQAEVHIFHYTKIEADRERAHGSVLTEEQVEKMVADWDTLNETLNSIFPARVLESGCLGD